MQIPSPRSTDQILMRGLIRIIMTLVLAPLSSLWTINKTNVPYRQSLREDSTLVFFKIVSTSVREDQRKLYKKWTGKNIKVREIINL